MTKDRAETVVNRYVRDFVTNNSAARILDKGLSRLGVGLRPLVDHITVRTFDVDQRSKEFLSLGFRWDRSVGRRGVLSYDDWWAKVYRKPGFPAVFIDQAFGGKRGKTSIIPKWVERYGDRVLHHIAVLVDDIETAVRLMKRKGIRFAGGIVGRPGSDLRQVFTVADVRKGHPFTVVEVIERHRGYQGFQPPQADSLMKASVISKKLYRT